MHWRSVLFGLLCTGAAQAQPPVSLQAFLSSGPVAPEEFVISKFARYDLVLIGEPHWVRQHVTLVSGLIPRLYTAGVNVLAIEFARRSDQAQIDSLLNGAVYDERLARRTTMQCLVQWGYQEYVDLYRAAWQVNQKLPPGTPRFRILGLGNSPDYSVIRTRKDLDDPQVRRKFLRGETEKDWATLLIDSVLARHQKALVYCGTHHAFTKYAQPIVSDGYVYLGPISRYEPVSPIADFIDEGNIEYARAHSYNPADRAASIAGLNQGIAGSLEGARKRWQEAAKL